MYRLDHRAQLCGAGLEQRGQQTSLINSSQDSGFKVSSENGNRSLMGAERALVRGILLRSRGTILKAKYTLKHFCSIFTRQLGCALCWGSGPLFTQVEGPARLNHDLCECLPSLIAAACQTFCATHPALKKGCQHCTLYTSVTSHVRISSQGCACTALRNLTSVMKLLLPQF